MSLSIYIHIPFCAQRCLYCDFNTCAGQERLIPAYINALIKEIRLQSEGCQTFPIHSIYIGGGTPSIVPINDYILLFSSLIQSFDLSPDCEISIEVNPGTIHTEYLDGLKALGVNRISIGAQSMNSVDLMRLGRIHDPDDIFNSISDARKAGFDNISLDMIFGLPWQDLADWKSSLSSAVNLNPDHFSLYSLIVEPGTPMYSWYQRGLISPQNQDLEAEMYELAIEVLDNAGYTHYEISNWARNSLYRNFRCRQNLQYWKNEPYLGLGAGAHGYFKGYRIVIDNDIAEYMLKIENHDKSSNNILFSPGEEAKFRVEPVAEMKDHMMLGLRLIEQGVSDADFQERYGKSFKSFFGDEIEELVKNNLLEWIGEDQRGLHLTRSGLMVANQVFMRFI